MLIVFCILLFTRLMAQANACERRTQLGLNQTRNIAFYPDENEVWNSCQWVVSSPPGTQITVACYYPYLPEGDRCGNDKISVSTTGDVEMKDAKVFCGPEGFKELSDSNEMVLKLEISKGVENGFFMCNLGVLEGPDECNCGNRNTARIVGGEETGINEFPMMAALVRSSNGVIFCGATIISNRYALTAAHCVRKVQPKDVALLVGEHDHTKADETKSTKTIKIDRFIAHKDFNKEGYVENDIALVHLAKTISFNRNVGPACLPFSHKDHLFVSETVYSLGWGQTQLLGPLNEYSNFLRKAELTALDDVECAAQIYFSTTALCLFKTGRGICNRDSGGPSLWQDPVTSKLILVGIHRSGSGCGRYNNINTRVTSFLDWIETNAVGAKFCKN